MDSVSQWWPFGAYWNYAFAIAVAVYGTFKFIGGHFSDDTKANLSLWLQGDYDSTWAKQFCNWFDHVFGKDHLSWNCFFRSSIASVLSVLVIYGLLGPILGVLTLRLDSETSLVQVLLLGMVLNLIPDFLSLYETRWILQRFDRVKGFGLNLVLLLVDAFVSAVIIGGAIFLYKTVTGIEGSMGHTFGALDVTVIFFCSSFLTSLFAWLYCLSSGFAKSVYRLRKPFDVTKNPQNTIALFSAAWLLVFSFGLKWWVDSIDRTAPQQLSVYDRLLCDAFADTCPRIARLTTNELEAMALLSDSCFSGESLMCNYFNKMQFEEHEYEALVLYWTQACEGGKSISCFKLGYMYHEGQGVEQDDEQSAKWSEKACEGGIGPGCVNLGIMYTKGWGVEKDPEQASKLFRKACELDISRGCANLGIMYRDDWGVEQDHEQASKLFRKACEGEGAEACTFLGTFYRYGRGVEQDDEQASKLFRKACGGGDAKACTFLGFMYHKGLGVEQDPESAAKWRKKACDLGYTEACGEDLVYE